MMPSSYLAVISNMVQARCRKGGKSLEKVKAKFERDDPRTAMVLGSIERRTALAQETMDYCEHISRGGSIIQHAIALGWKPPPICVGRLEEEACDWIDNRWLH